MNVKVKDMKPGDIFRCAYGDYDNIVEGVFEKAEPYEHGWTKIYVRFDNRPTTMYDDDCYEKAELEVLGHDANYQD